MLHLRGSSSSCQNQIPQKLSYLGSRWDDSIIDEEAEREEEQDIRIQGELTMFICTPRSKKPPELKPKSLQKSKKPPVSRVLLCFSCVSGGILANMNMCTQGIGNDVYDYICVRSLRVRNRRHKRKTQNKP